MHNEKSRKKSFISEGKISDQSLSILFKTREKLGKMKKQKFTNQQVKLNFGSLFGSFGSYTQLM